MVKEAGPHAIIVQRREKIPTLFIVTATELHLPESSVLQWEMMVEV